MRKGFTLIELLVVIAIIGILSSVVLASLNSARSKGSDAAIKSNISNARAQAELWYDSQTTPTYAGMCRSASGLEPMLTAVQAIVGTGTGDTYCYGDAGGWVFWSSLKSDVNQVYCVAGNGQSTTTAKSSVSTSATSTCF